MSPSEENSYKDEIIELKKQLENISDQLCLAVKGEFDFTIDIKSIDESVQKLTMLVNFVLDSARRALLEVRDKNAKLTELDKLKSDFMANISHELRTPLTLILGPLETILKDDDAIPKNLQENLYRMQRNAARLYILVNDMLDFSKLEAGKFIANEELIDLRKFISQIVDDAQGLAHERKITLSFSSQDELGLMLFDSKMIEKITLNLISNALKFTRDGGHVDVQLVKQENMVQIIVTDNGIGIPAEKIQHLFKRFYQVDTSTTRGHEGTGIGLALVHQFIELMRGKINVESVQEKGSKFIVTLPICTAITSTVDTQTIIKAADSVKVPLSLLNIGKHLSEKPGITKNNIELLGENKLPLILVADDNLDMRSYIISLLENDYQIVAVENGKLALDAVYKYHPQVILADVMMTVMDGYQLTKALKADPKTQHIPIILITAKAGKDAVISSFEVGADDYLSKPFTAVELKARTATAFRLYQNYMNIVEVNNKLIDEIEERNKLEAKNASLNKQLITAARRAGMADIATSILHNIGNVLNSVNISVSMLDEKIKHAKLDNLTMLAKLLQQHQDDMETFLIKNPQGQLIPNYLIALSDAWVNDKKYLVEELSQLYKNVQHINEIILKQNSISEVLGMTEEVVVSELIDDALILNKFTYEKAKIEIVRDFTPIKKIMVDRVKLLQIMVNLIRNSIDSLVESTIETKKIILNIRQNNDSQIMIQIRDNGVGVAPENITKVFSHGFTTKKHGHGFGLHNSIIYAKEMGGNLSLISEGIGKGATFTLNLPCKP